MTTIVIADDHPVVRKGVCALLEAEPDIKVVGEAGDGPETVRLVWSLQPDVLVLDLSMSVMSGLEITQQVRKLSPQTAICILSMHSHESYVREVIRAGAKGYVLKESAAEELVHAVHEVIAGHSYLSAALAERAFQSYAGRNNATVSDSYEALSMRERQVLHSVVQGQTNAEIAQELRLSRRTIEVYRSSMMHKLGLHTTADVLRYAMKRGILPSTP